MSSSDSRRGSHIPRPVHQRRSIPEGPRHRRAHSVRDHIPPVCNSVARPDPRPDPFANQRPQPRARRDFPPGRRRIVASPSKTSIRPQQPGQRRRNQQQIVEMTVEKARPRVRFDEEAVHRIKRTCPRADGIEGVPEPLHRSAKIKKPAPMARLSCPTTGMKRRNECGMFMGNF
jgi:hypothetical protein